MAQRSDPLPTSAAQAEERLRRSLAGRRGLHAEAEGDLKPIGPARLRALREAIRNGSYPSDACVEEGLRRMLLDPARRRPSDT